MAGLAWLAAGPARAITGVCPDGSIYVVPSPELIPCENSKRVQPHEVPPLRPENLPRPYTWQVYNEANDPNNAYNLIDAASKVRALRDAGAAPPEPGATGTEEERSPLRLRPSDRAPVASPPVDLGLTDGELRDLFYIVEFSQERAPASFVRDTADGNEILRLSLAHSDAFQARLEEAWRQAGTKPRGPVLLFGAIARRETPFYGNFTFSQAHLTFQPKADDPSQLGVLQGRLGPLDGGDAVLGYVILPEQMQLERPLDIYWNDRRVRVLFRP